MSWEKKKKRDYIPKTEVVKGVDHVALTRAFGQCVDMEQCWQVDVSCSLWMEIALFSSVGVRRRSSCDFLFPVENGNPHDFNGDTRERSRTTKVRSVNIPPVGMSLTLARPCPMLVIPLPRLFLPPDVSSSLTLPPLLLLPPSCDAHEVFPLFPHLSRPCCRLPGSLHFLSRS